MDLKSIQAIRTIIAIGSLGVLGPAHMESDIAVAARQRDDAARRGGERRAAADRRIAAAEAKRERRRVRNAKAGT